MSNKFTNVITTGFGGRIINSIKGIFIGFILFIVSFAILYWNEGRVDLSNIAKTAIEISSATVNTNSELNGKLISMTGDVNSDEIIGDNLFLNPDNFIAVKRKVEMYSWVEKSESHSTTNIGGSETTETTYTYLKDWKENPESSSYFKHPEGHENPQKSLSDYENKATVATIGVYNFNPQSVILPEFSRLFLNSQNTTLSDNAILSNDDYVFIKKSDNGTFDNPQIGDLRVSYYALRSGFESTIFGKLNENKINPFFDQKGNSVYHLFIGTREQGVSTLHGEYTTQIWLFRLGGFLLMWFGLMTLLNPISTLLDVLPIFGTISRSVIAIATFLFALVLTIITILISMVIHSLVALIIVLLIVVGAIIIFFVVLKNKKKAITSQATNMATSVHNVSSTKQELEDHIRDTQEKI